MEGIFIPNAPQGDVLDEAVKEEEESKLVTTVEEIASAMLRLALEFGEKGFLQREFIVYLRKLMREITGEEQPQPNGAAAMPLPAQPDFGNVCPHPEHRLQQEFVGGGAAGGSPNYNRSPNQPRSRRNIFSPLAEVDAVSPGGDYRGQGGMQRSPRMQSPSRLGATKKIPATVHRMERQMPIPATPMNVTFNLPPGATTGRKYTYADLTPPSPGAQSYSDATNSGEWVPQAGAFIPCRMTPVNPPMNDSYYCQHLRPSPKQNLFGQGGGGSSPTNDSYYCQPLPQTPAMSQRTATGRKSTARRPRPGSPSRCGPSCNRR